MVVVVDRARVGVHLHPAAQMPFAPWSTLLARLKRRLQAEDCDDGSASAVTPVGQHLLHLHLRCVLPHEPWLCCLLRRRLRRARTASRRAPARIAGARTLAVAPLRRPMGTG